MNQPLPIRKTQGEQEKKMTSKVDMREEIQELVDYASENMGNDVLLAQTTDDLLTLITKIRLEDLEEVKEELLNWDWRHASGIEIRYYLDSKIKELGE